MEHTPGPWEAKKLLCDGKIVNKAGWEIHTPGYDVCTLVFVGAPIRKEADAYLIAAAPDLLAACMVALAWIRETIELVVCMDGIGVPYDEDIAMIAQIVDAIAKAKGE